MPNDMNNRVRRAVKSALKGELSRVLKSPNAWAMICKGGLEHTFRDLLLADIQSALVKSKFVVTGERHRYDVAIYERSKLIAPQSDFRWNHPTFVLELKFNFLSQAHALHRSAKDLAKSETKFGKSGLVFICEVLEMDAVSKELLERYVKMCSTRPTPKSDINKIILAESTRFLKNPMSKYLHRFDIEGDTECGKAVIHVVWITSSDFNIE